MGLFDKIKNTVVSAANDAKNAYAQASAMGPEMLGCRQALYEKCEAMTEDQLEEFYAYIKKQGTILKAHPGRDAVESVLIDRHIYIRNEDGTLTMNLRLFK